MKKVNTLQIVFIYIITVASVGVFILPNAVSGYSGRAAVLNGLISAAVGVIMAFMLNSMIIKSGSVYLFFKENFGVGFADTFGIVLSVWLLILSVLFVRSFYERIGTTVFAFMPRGACEAALVILCFISLTQGSGVFGRVGETVFIILIITLSFITIFSLSGMDAKELFPMRAASASGFMKGFFVPVASFSYLFYYLYFADRAEQPFKKGTLYYGALSGSLMTVFMIGVSITTFGLSFGSKIAYPFLAVIKSISLASKLDHFGSVFSGIWIMMDFTAVAAFLHCAWRGFERRKVKNNFKRETVFKFLICAAVYAFSLFPYANSFTLNTILSRSAAYVNIILGPAAVIILYATAIFTRRKKLDFKKSN